MAFRWVYENSPHYVLVLEYGKCLLEKRSFFVASLGTEILEAEGRPKRIFELRDGVCVKGEGFLSRVRSLERNG